MFGAVRDMLLTRLDAQSVHDGVPCPEHLEPPEQQMRSLLLSCKRQRVSSSIFVFGAAGGGREQVVSHAVAAALPGTKIATVKGLLCESDEDAIFSIADQLCVRNDRSYGLALQDITEQLRTAGSRANGDPVVIVIEDIQHFAKARKQILIYTLLDLMHNPQLLFVLVGMTSNAFISNVFEKRICSRLNAQYIFLPRPTCENVLRDLHRRLWLPEHLSSWCPGVSYDESEYSAFRQSFNAQLLLAFGSLDSLCLNAALRASVSERLANGFGLQFFYKSAMAAVLSLPWSMTRSPLQDLLLNAASFEQGLTSSDPPSFADQLRSLPMLQLQVVSALTLAELRARSSLSDRHLSIKDAHVQFQRLVNSSEVCEEAFIEAVVALERRGLVSVGVSAGEGIKAYTAQDTVKLVPAPRLLQEAFASTDSSSRVVIAARIREAVLNPSAAVVTTSLLASRSSTEHAAEAAAAYERGIML